MKFLNVFLFILLSITVSAQVIIESADLPVMGDTLETENVILTGSTDLDESGPDHTWVFDTDALQPTGIFNTTPCLAEDDAPFLYQLLFNNPFYPEYNADFAFGVDDFTIVAITFSDNYWFYQNNDDSYVSVGFGTTINDVPLPTTVDPVDVIYELPLHYEDTHSGYSELNIEIPTIGSYGLQQVRSYEVDGWGTLELWGEEYEVLRVRSEIEATDSIYIDFIQTGQSIERPLAIEYKWLSPDFNVPVLQINTSAGFVTSAQAIHINEIIENAPEINTATLSLYPNPSSDFIQLTYPGGQRGTASIYNANGLTVSSQTVTGNDLLDVSKLTVGEYFVIVRTENGATLHSNIVIE